MISYRSIHMLILRALGSDTYHRRSEVSHEWDISGDCLNPVLRELWAHPKGGRVRLYTKADRHPLQMDLYVRCRKCTKCLEKRRKTWVAKAYAEHAKCMRSWFGTLTFRPEEHYRIYCLAAAHSMAAGKRFDELNNSEKWKLLQKFAGDEITKWLKRLRKKSGAKLRYFLTAEQHKSGLPHYHVIIHQVQGRVTWRDLATTWKVGFVKFNLITGTGAVGYVAKYLGKTLDARVRASLRYGKIALQHSEALSERVKKSHSHEKVPFFGKKQYSFEIEEIERKINELSSLISFRPGSGQPSGQLSGAGGDTARTRPATTPGQRQPFASASSKRQQAGQNAFEQAYAEHKSMARSPLRRKSRLTDAQDQSVGANRSQCSTDTLV